MTYKQNFLTAQYQNQAEIILTGDDPNNFCNPHNHYDKVTEVKIYDKDGNLKKIVSPQEQLNNKWEQMHIDPLIHSPQSSRQGLAKRKKGQEKYKKNFGSFKSKRKNTK